MREIKWHRADGLGVQNISELPQKPKPPSETSCCCKLAAAGLNLSNRSLHKADSFPLHIYFDRDRTLE